MRHAKAIALNDRSVTFRMNLFLVLTATAFVVLTMSLSALALLPH